ncbi:MAG: hypothetical protein NTW86_07220 [Candidatus Sumerlaeota bacterium]|nr:hypothetical protein [Candidatus Sumerlaeota bacterium]
MNDRPEITRFVEGRVRPYVLKMGLESAYRDMAADGEREAEALEWAKSVTVDSGNELFRGIAPLV